MTTPTTVSDLFPSRWLKAADLRGRTATVTIAKAQIEQLHNPRTNQKEIRLVLFFAGKSKQLCLNKTQAMTLARITGTEEFEHWPGHIISLSPAETRNGQDTITISQPPIANGNGGQTTTETQP